MKRHVTLEVDSTDCIGEEMDVAAMSVEEVIEMGWIVYDSLVDDSPAVGDATGEPK